MPGLGSRSFAKTGSRRWRVARISAATHSRSPISSRTRHPTLGRHGLGRGRQAVSIPTVWPSCRAVRRRSTRLGAWAVLIRTGLRSGAPGASSSLIESSLKGDYESSVRLSDEKGGEPTVLHTGKANSYLSMVDAFARSLGQPNSWRPNGGGGVVCSRDRERGELPVVSRPTSIWG